MELNAGNINALTTRVNTAFNRFLQAAENTYSRFSMTVPSTAAENFYPYLSELSGLREWVGHREIERLKVGGFRIMNRTFQHTLAVRREALEDDQFGVIQPALHQQAYNASLLPDELVYDALMAGTSTICMDGQNFFDTDHVTYTESGSQTSYANIGVPQGTEAAGPAWYLFVTKQPLRPMIFQTRRPFVITAKTKVTDDNVFEDNEFIWGIDGRCNAGVGMWQMAYRSTRPLTASSLSDAVVAMGGLRRKDGTPYALRPDLLVVPRNLETQANEVVKGSMVPVLAPDGKTWLPGSNPVQNLVDVMVGARLSYANGG